MIERAHSTAKETGLVCGAARVKVKGHRELVTVVRSPCQRNAGEWITAEGKGCRTRARALQF